MFTPIFTSGKMKAMLIFMQETCNQLVNCLDNYADTNEDFELKDTFGKYSMDTLATCAFGVNSGSFSNKESKFVEYAKNVFQQTMEEGIKILMTLIPGGFSLLKWMKIPVFKKTSTEFFQQVITTTLKHRREQKIRRNDLVDMMLDAIKGDTKYDGNEDEDQFEKVGTSVIVVKLYFSGALYNCESKLGPKNR